MFFEEDFGFRSRLELACPAIRREIERFPAEDFTEWPNNGAYEGGWFAFGLYACTTKLVRNCSRFPETTRLVESIPGLNTAGFSAITPGTFISPHAGTPPQVLRCHLALITPPEAWICVGGVTKHYEVGKTLVFDETASHHVRNQGATPRVVLLIDFLKPPEMMQGVVARDEQGLAARKILTAHFSHWLDEVPIVTRGQERERENQAGRPG